MNDDVLMQADPTGVSLALPDSMESWGEDKRRDFIAMFQTRSRAARYLLYQTASELHAMASKRRFIARKHDSKIYDARGKAPALGWHEHQNMGRTIGELNAIAEQRAAQLLAELPPLKDAVRVIAPDTAAHLDRLGKLRKLAQAAYDELAELDCTVDLRTIDQDMTVAELRRHIAALDKRREKLIKTINKHGGEAASLQAAVDKALYAGLPGLSDVVVDVIASHYERVTALAQMERRVAEQVLFGDSEAASQLLSAFERDEAKVSDDLQAQVAGAMQALKDAVAKTKKRKALKGGGK